MPIFRSQRFGLRASTESIPGSVQRDANCAITSARPAARRLAGLTICVQITLVSRLGVSTTGISRLPWRRSGRRRCALGQCCHQAFSISRALDRFRARVKRNPAISAGGPARAQRRRFLLQCAPLTHSNTCYTSSVILGLGVSPMRRRDFIALIGSSVAGWPLAARAQQAAVPVIGYLDGGSLGTSAHVVAAIRKGLSETGYVEGTNVVIEYHWAEGNYNRLPVLVPDLVRRQVAIIIAMGTPVAFAAKAATSTIPIVFGGGIDPVKAGLVASLHRPGGNITGVTSMNAEIETKRLGLLHELLPRATRFAVLVKSQ